MIIKCAAILMLLLAILMTQVTPPQKMVKYSVLAIEYVGDSDKPIPTIIISDGEQGTEYYQKAFLKPYKWDSVAVHVIRGGGLIESLIAQTESFERSVHSKEKKISGPVENVSVTRVTAEGKKNFLLGTESAIPYLDSLEEQCKGDEFLRSDIAYFRKRIRR